MNEQLTFSYMRFGNNLERAMHQLGVIDSVDLIPNHWSIGAKVVAQTLLAYDAWRASGAYTRGNVPKPKTLKQHQTEEVVYRRLLDLANAVLNPNQSDAATQDLIMNAWRAVAPEEVPA